VGLSVGGSVRSSALQKRLNRLRCRFGVDLGGPKELCDTGTWRVTNWIMIMMYYMTSSPGPPGEGDILRGESSCPGHPWTCPAVDIGLLKATYRKSAGAETVRCGCRLECTRWGAHWRNLANTNEPSVYSDHLHFVLNFFSIYISP